MKIRIQKVIANAGLCSRRKAEALIEQQEISINGKLAIPGASVEEGDKIKIGSKFYLVETDDKERISVIAYYKPEGELVSRDDPQKRKNVFQRLPKMTKGRWIAVGRLDINTSGLLLFTNNGELANRLMHPSYEVNRIYAVRVLGTATDEQLERIKSGVDCEGDMLSFDAIEDAGGEGTNHWYHVTLSEGKNHEVRRIWSSLGMMVSRLIRIQYGVIKLTKDTPRGKWRYLQSGEINKLMASVQMENVKPETFRLTLMTKKGKYKVKQRY